MANRTGAGTSNHMFCCIVWHFASRVACLPSAFSQAPFLSQYSVITAWEGMAREKQQQTERDCCWLLLLLFVCVPSLLSATVGLLVVYLTVTVTWITVVILELIHAHALCKCLSVSSGLNWGSKHQKPQQQQQQHQQQQRQSTTLLLLLLLLLLLCYLLLVSGGGGRGGGGVVVVAG